MMRMMVIFSTRTIVDGCTAVAVDMRRDGAPKQPSPKKSPCRKIAMTAFLPRLDRTVSFTLPAST